MKRLTAHLRTRWPYLAATAAPLILFARFLTGHIVLYWGTIYYQFYPWRLFALDAIRSGRLPLWNPYVGNGSPLLANYQSAVFYPLNWLSLLLPLPYSFTWLVLLHLILAGAGMVTLTRSLGISRFGQAISGLAFGMSQYLVGRVGFLSMSAALAWFPWIIWSADRVAYSPKPGRPALWFCAFALLELLAGHAQITWYTYLFLAAWILYRFSSKRFSPGRAAVLASSLLLAAGMAAVQLIPTAEFLSQSSRSTEYGFEGASAYSLSPLRLINFLAPDLFGNPARNSFFGYGAYWEDANYLGVLPLFLGLGYLLSRFRKTPPPIQDEAGAPLSSTPRSMPLFLGAVMLVALVLALGSHTPVYPFLYKYIPTFNMFQGPTRMMIWFDFNLALLAGFAVDEWNPPQGKELYWTRLGLAGALTLLLVGSATFFLIPSTTITGNETRTMAGASALAGLTLALSAVLTLTQPARSSSRRKVWMLVVVAFLSLDLFNANWGNNPGAPSSFYSETSAPAPLDAQGHRIFQYPSEETQVKYGSYLVFKKFQPPGTFLEARTVGMADLNMLNGVRSANNYDPLLVSRYLEFTKAAEEVRSQNLLRLADVTLLATVQNEKFQFQEVESPSRVWLVTTAQLVADGPAALEALKQPGFDPEEAMILEKDDPGLLASHDVAVDFAPSFPAVGSARIVEDQPEKIGIVANLPRDGWLILSDTYYPGWYAFVDGTPVAVLHADYAFRAVQVPEGAHQIEFRYEPLSFRAGLIISALSSIIFIVLALRMVHRI